jgi:hypothetical protein
MLSDLAFEQTISPERTTAENKASKPNSLCRASILRV